MNKIALIFGNSRYPESPLKNPVNDALSLERKLTSLGFDCKVCTDASFKEMDQALQETGDEMSNYEVCLCFFAGHGMQIQGNNYLCAIDTNFKKEINVKHSSLPLDEVIDVMETGLNKTSIIILDACRNNPYERRLRGESRGLAPVYAPKGMIIAYATSPGQYAFDGTGENGAYTSALLKHISTQGISIEDLFKRVRNTLSSSTKGKQISWEHTSLMGDFCFNYPNPTTELVPEYSKNALADRLFQPSPSSPIRETIQSLKSRDWGLQNPAINRLSPDKLSLCGKDELFVLGRNIYQTACGPAWAAQEYFDNLEINLVKLEKNVSFHVLNGMLYEIYFDSQGRKRKEAKIGCFEQVMSMEGVERFASSFEFIQEALLPYSRELFYFPGTLKTVNIDVSTVLIKKDQRVVSGVFYEGDNILYTWDETSYFNPREVPRYPAPMDVQEIKTRLSSMLVTPISRLNVEYDTDDSELVCAFSAMVIRRFSS